MLNSFKSTLGSYDDYSIRVKMVYDEELSVNNQAVAFCLAHEDYGVQCGTASTGSSATEATYMRTYYFSDYTTTIANIKDSSPLDLWDSTNDSYYIDDYYYGMTQYYLRLASTTTLVGDKFQFKEPSNVIQWTNVKDYRFKAGDTISLYRMQQSNALSISWDWNENRVLSGAMTTMSGLIAATALFIAF